MASISRRGKTWRAQVCVNLRRSSKTFRTEAMARLWAERQEGRVAGMPALRAAIEDHRLAMALSPRLLDAIGLANYTNAEIIEAALPLHADCGVYFLIRNSEITYVGQTTNLLFRLYKHRNMGRRFDSFAFIPCQESDLDRLESTYIALLMPGQNRML